MSEVEEEVPYTVAKALARCGMSEEEGPASVEKLSDAKRVAKEVFQDDFNKCMDISFKNLEKDFETFEELPQNEKITFSVSTRKNIKEFIQWVRDQVRCGKDPTLSPFPVDNIAELLRRHATHEAFVKKSLDLSDAARPEKLKVASV